MDEIDVIERSAETWMGEKSVETDSCEDDSAYLEDDNKWRELKLGFEKSLEKSGRPGLRFRLLSSDSSSSSGMSSSMTLGLVPTTGGLPFLKAISLIAESDVCCEIANGNFFGS